MGGLDDLGGVIEVGLEVLLMRAVVHDGGEACVDALKDILECTMIEVQGNGDADVLDLDEIPHDVCNDFVGGLPLGRTAGALDDDRRLKLLGSIQNRSGPLEVVGVKRS